MLTVNCVTFFLDQDDRHDARVRKIVELQLLDRIDNILPPSYQAGF